MGGRRWDNNVYSPPLGPCFHVFWPTCYAGDTKFIESGHFTNRSVRRHLNKHTQKFSIFSGFQTAPGGSWSHEKT